MITGKLDTPLQFGRFSLIAKVSAGGMATVFRAQVPAGDPLEGKPIAIKILHDHLCDQADFISMFKDEGRIARDFDHPNVARVFEVSEIEGRHYLAMEFVEGRDLAQILHAMRANHQVMPAPPAFEILRQALTALRYVHAYKGKGTKSLGIVHRDISPQNLLISREPMVKVTDFGIARGAHRSDRTRTGTVKGKMHYMAPEQARGERVDARADLYALGAVAYEMMTGQPLFGPGTTEVLQSRAMKGAVEFGPKFEKLSLDVQTWLRKALARSVEERFHSADAMLAALELIPKGGRQHYKPEVLLRLMDLPEASRARQREAVLPILDEAMAQGRISTGGVIQQPISQVRPSSLPPGKAFELDSEQRSKRLGLGGQDINVDWQGSVEPSLRPVSDSRSNASEIRRNERRNSRVDLLPAEVIVGKSYVPDGATLAATSKKLQAFQRAGSDAVDVLDPASFRGRDAETPEDKPVPSPSRRQTRPSPSKISRVNAESQSLALSAFAAWSCAAFVLFAVLMEVTGSTVQLPELTDEKLAALFDADAPVVASDGTQSPKGAGANRSKEIAGEQGSQPRLLPPLRPVDLAAAPPPLKVVPENTDESAARQERRERRAREGIAERMGWQGRPVESVVKPDSPDGDDEGEVAHKIPEPKKMIANERAGRQLAAAAAQPVGEQKAKPLGVAGVSPAPAAKVNGVVVAAAKAQPVVAAPVRKAGPDIVKVGPLSPQEVHNSPKPDAQPKPAQAVKGNEPKRPTPVAAQVARPAARAPSAPVAAVKAPPAKALPGKPVVRQAVAAKGGAAKPVAAKPVVAKAPAAKVVAAKPVVGKAPAAKVVPAKPIVGKAPAAKVVAAKPVVGKAPAAKVVPAKPVVGKAPAAKAAPAKPVLGKAVAGKAVAPKPAAGRPLAPKAAAVRPGAVVNAKPAKVGAANVAKPQIAR